MAKITIDNIIENNSLPSILLLYGADKFTLSESLDKLLKSIVKTETDKIDFSYLDAEETNQNAIVNIALQLPMMAEKRVVVVRRFDKLFSGRRKKSDATPIIEKYLDSPNNSTLLILVADGSDDLKIDFAKPPYSIIKNKHQVLEFPIVYENQLPTWTINRFKQKKITISHEAAELIVSQTPPDLRSLANEVEKISLHYLGNKEISLENIANIIGISRQNTVFELVKAIGEKSTKKAIAIMSNILAVSSQEVLIITVISDFFVKLWKLMDIISKNYPREEMARQIGLRNAYFLNDYMNALNKYTPEEISNTFSLLCEADSKLKSTNSNSKLIIEKLIIELTF